MTVSYGGTPPGITGTHYGGASIGVRGIEVPPDGLAGPGYIYNGLTLPDDAAKRVRGVITTWPAAGLLFPQENSAFTYTGPEGFALYRLYVDGVASAVDIGDGPGVGRLSLAGGASETLFAAVSATGSVTYSGTAAVLAAVVEAAPPGEALSDGEMRQMFVWVSELARIHGLVAGSPLVVTPTSRQAGAISQSISESGSTVTVSRA